MLDGPHTTNATKVLATRSSGLEAGAGARGAETADELRLLGVTFATLPTATLLASPPRTVRRQQLLPASGTE